MDFFDAIGQALYQAFIEDNRYILILRGLGNTLIIALFATIIGTIIGLCVAIIKVLTHNNRKLRIFSWICDVYITVIRGTPVAVQLLIMYGSILLFIDDSVKVAIITFGINSGAYVAEIVRAGILAVDQGQTEAGRSLGLTQGMTMRSIVLPQAFKNILPALGNEFIALLKETSIAGYIACMDLTKAANNIYTRTFNVAPLYIVAVIYLLLVMCMTFLLKRVERRLSKSDHR